jgi:hypothetical protein
MLRHENKNRTFSPDLSNGREEFIFENSFRYSTGDKQQTFRTNNAPEASPNYPINTNPGTRMSK